MKKYPPYLFVLALVLLLGCDQIIDIDLPKQDPVLVVNAPFTPDSAWQASVTSSQSIQVQDPPKAVTNAQILILENGVVVDTLTHNVDDRYSSAAGRSPVAGRSYTLQASAPGFATVTGSDMAPNPVVPFNLTWRDSVTKDQGNYWYGEFSLSINDPAGANNYYSLEVYSLDTFIYGLDTSIYLYPVNVQIQDPLLEYNVYSGGVLFQDETFDGGSRTISVQIGNDAHDYSFLFFGLSTVSESYFRYTQTLSSYYETGFNPFAEPVRIYSNMTPSMGIFAGFSTSFGLVP